MQQLFLPLKLAAVLLCPLFAQADNLSAVKTTSFSQSLNLKNQAIPVQLTLSAALALAINQHPELAAAKREILASEAAIRQARMPPNPELSIVMEDLRAERRSTSVQINQAFELGGKRGARTKLAQFQLSAAENELRIKAAEIRAAVSQHFFAVLIAQERQRIAMISLELAQRSNEAANKQVGLGKIAPLAANKAAVAQAGVKLELAQANSELQIAKQSLALSLGLGAANSFPAEQQFLGEFNTLPSLPTLETLLQSLPQSPLMQRAQIEVAKREAMTALEKTQQVPDLTLSLGAKREQETGRQQAIFGLSIPLPLFERSHLQEVLARGDKARDELRASEIRAQSELRQAHQRLSLAREQAALLEKEVLPIAQNAFDSAMKGFEYGKFNFLDVLDAQRSLLQAKTQYLHTLSDAQQAASEIQVLIGERDLSLFLATSPF